MDRSDLEKMLCLPKDYFDGNIYIWGTGNTTLLYLQGLERLERSGEMVVEGFGDNNPKKWGTLFWGKNIYSPDEIKMMDNPLVLINSAQPSVIASVSKQMNEAGIRCMNIDLYILSKHKLEVLTVYDLLEDDRSKEVYAQIIKCHIEGVNPDVSIVDKEQYFSFGAFADYDPEGIYIDCGAYVGDTLEQYIWKTSGAFKKIIAFEPDEKNAKALLYRVERLKREWGLEDNQIEFYPYGLSDNSSISYVERRCLGNGLSSKILSEKSYNSNEVKIVSIDDVVSETYSFLKADIESYEYRMILGARKSIELYKPRLAICIYHNAVDLYSILLLLRDINVNYKFGVRHYSHSLCDTILYAY